MDTFIGLLELVGWVVAIVAIAATVTFTVIKVFPGRGERKKDTAETS